jgi:DNA-binding winged helix-turn-helix (wHTH) protein
LKPLKTGHGAVVVFGSSTLDPEEIEALAKRMAAFLRRYDPSVEVVATAKSVTVPEDETITAAIRRELITGQNIPAVSDVLEIDWSAGLLRYHAGDYLARFVEHMTTNEHKLLHLLVDAGGEPIATSQINEAFGFLGVSPQSLRSLVTRLRRKLGPFRENLFTVTPRDARGHRIGGGYGFRLADNILIKNDERNTHYAARHTPVLQLRAMDGGADRDERRRA